MIDQSPIDRYAKGGAAFFALTVLGLGAGFFLVRDSSWLGTKDLHTMMEIAATLLSLVVGILGLVRYHAKRESTILLVGAAFLGTSFLDGYHAVLTSLWFEQLIPSPPKDMIPWSWNASRTFLAILMYFSLVAWRREERTGTVGSVSNRKVYAGVGVLTLASFAFFALAPLPDAYYPDLLFGRPEEFVSAAFFLAALIGYLRKGAWKQDPVEFGIVSSLIIGLACQAAFMSSSYELFDAMFDVAHALKIVTYVCVLTGLLVSLSRVLVQAERDRAALLDHRDRLLQRTEDLETANRELSEYDHVVAHDLRAPLRGIRQYVDFLREDLKGSLGLEQEEYLDGLTESTDKADALVNDLLTLSRIGRKSMPSERIQVGAFLMELCRAPGFSPDVNIVAAEEWPEIYIEPLLMQMIFKNLLENAVKFNDSPKKQIDLEWGEPDPDHWTISVRDNGIGIAPRFHEKIFRVFERLHSDEEYEGTGIGLAIVRKAVNQLNGSIRLESEHGQGTAFHVTLPKTSAI